MSFRVVCAWCGRVLREGDVSKLVSHGICEDCEQKLYAKYPGETKKEKKHELVSETGPSTD